MMSKKDMEKHVVAGSRRKIPKPGDNNQHIIFCKRYQPNSKQGGYMTFCIQDGQKIEFEEKVKNLRAAKFIGKKIITTTSGGTLGVLTEVFDNYKELGQTVLAFTK